MLEIVENPRNRFLHSSSLSVSALLSSMKLYPMEECLEAVWREVGIKASRLQITLTSRLLVEAKVGAQEGLTEC